MRALIILVVAFAIGSNWQSWADDACSGLAIEAEANVQVSDGNSFQVATAFHSKRHASFRQINDDSSTLIVAEGPGSWVRNAGEDFVGTDFHKLFALGHQFHAFLLHFNHIAENVRLSEAIEFQGENRAALSGDYPYGGSVHLIKSANPQKPVGLLFEFPDIPPITVVFADWRWQEGALLPFQLSIDDGTSVFTYLYRNIEIQNRAPDWFIQALGPTVLDEVALYRLHRQLLVAHCIGDAEMMSRLSTDEIISSNRGVLEQTQQNDMKDRLSRVFQIIDYTAYLDLKPPILQLSASGDFAIIAVEVEARGNIIEDGSEFADQWSWFMLAKKVDGQWRHAGNASNLKVESAQ